MTIRLQISLVLISTLCAFTATATAEPCWITYEGNDLPENEGWGRSWGNDDGQYHGDGAIRTVENGILTMDSLYDLRVYDYAYVGLPGQLDPDPGEMFIVEWRLKVDEVIGGYYDPSIGIKSDTRMTVGLGYHVDRIESVFEDGVFIPITAGVFHEYRMLSSDMQTYELYVDGELAHLGTFWQGAGESRVGWGAPVSGASSRSHWDFVRFGVVPEPSVVWLFVGGLAACVLRTLRGGVRRVVLLPILACILSASATAEPYWIAYEGNDFPENEGWQRWVSDPPAERWLADGSFFLDSRGIVGSVDNYTIYFDEGLDPELGETFIMSWKLNVHEATHGEDAGVYVISDDLWTVTFLFDEDNLESFYEPTVSVELEPYVYHEYQMRSHDMRTYRLYIDGDLAIEGVFFEGFFSPRAGFGDITSGTSLAAWDYFRFGVVPEPSAIWLLVAGLAACVLRTARGGIRRAVLLPVLACILTASATAEPFWITYEGNDFPENEGWTRFTGAGGADRWIEDGALVIDSLDDVHIHDVALMEHWMDPEPSELFVCEWRLLVEEESSDRDPGVAIARSFAPGFVNFYFGPNLAWNGLDNLWWEIQAGVFHTYRFESHNMVDFEFLIDGQLVQEGTFHAPSSNQSYVSFGDKLDGGVSLSRWDYVRFGVIPEPSASTLALAALCLTHRTIRKR